MSGHLIGPQRVDGSSPFGNGDDRLVAMGYLSETAAALIEGSLDLLLAGNRYATSALTRQLVEVEYVMWAFAEDQEEASSWLRSTDEERRQRWQPRHLRQRSDGRFRGSDYSEHCEVGGHPTPKGVRILLGGDPQETATNKELLVVELANYGMSAWKYLAEAVTAIDEEILSSPSVREKVHAVVDEWVRLDRLQQFSYAATN